MSCPNCGLENGEFYGHVCTGTYFGPCRTFSPPCAKCAQLEADLAAARAEAARLREKLDRLTVASERVLECEGWDWRYGKGWELLPYQAQLNQAVREAKAALERHP